MSPVEGPVLAASAGACKNAASAALRKIKKTSGQSAQNKWGKLRVEVFYFE